MKVDGDKTCCITLWRPLNDNNISRPELFWYLSAEACGNRRRKSGKSRSEMVELKDSLNVASNFHSVDFVRRELMSVSAKRFVIDGNVELDFVDVKRNFKELSRFDGIWLILEK